MTTLPNTGALFGLDLGTKTIGIAVSDGTQMIASPLETIRRKKFGVDAEKLLQLMKANNVVGLVLGLPKNMDGSDGPRVQATRAFAQNLSKLTDVPIEFWDERLSTAAVQRMMIEADTSRAKRAQVVDQMAAAYILQGFLDSRR